MSEPYQSPTIFLKLDSIFRVQMSLPFIDWEINGPVSVRPAVDIALQSIRYLIMGPTGSGKSSFIEALAGDSHKLNISGDQLASVTQRLTPYELINVKRYGLPVYIIDTPGFSDSKISEGEIIDMVRKWMIDNLFDIRNILFFIPINTTRLEGTKRRTLKMMEELLGKYELMEVRFVTTMWDQLANKNSQQRAVSNFMELQNVILKHWIDHGARLTIFNNDRLSALHILEGLKSRDSVGFHSAQKNTLLYHDLHERISMALQEKYMIEEQLNEPNNCHALFTILKKNHADNEDRLVKFIDRLAQVYTKPPEGYDDAHTQLKASISALGEELQDMQQRVQKRRDMEHRRLVIKNVLRKIERSTISVADIFKRMS